MDRRRTATIALACVLALVRAFAPALAYANESPARFPEWLRDPGWPLMAGCVGCGVLLGLIIGGVMVILARRMRARRDQIERSSPTPGEPPAEPPPPL